MLDIIWRDFLIIAREEVGSRVVETWLKAVNLARWDQSAGTIYIEAPNVFVKEWIYNNYKNLLSLHLGRLVNYEHPKILFFTKTEHTTLESEVHVQDSSGSLIPAKRTSTVGKGLVRTIRPASSLQSLKLNPQYTFDTFVVGPNNSLAYAAAQAVAEDPGKLYNPLYIYGNSGLGKTHLIQSIGNALQQKNPHALILYQTADRFVNEFINAIRCNKFQFFQQKYRELDILLIDDIQFISQKEQTQEAFFHIFNALHENGKQIVFSSDVFPRMIKGLAERLRSRLEWGLVADIHVPQLETKIAILQKKAAYHAVVLEDDIAEYIAHSCNGNVRELEGALIRILAFCSLTKTPLSLEVVKKNLGNHLVPDPVHAITCEKVAQEVCKHYVYTLSDLRSERREKDIALARQIAMYLMKKLTDKSLREIGIFLRRRNHSTVIHALEKIDQSLAFDTNLKEVLVALEQKIITNHRV
jgi:chromosomal replication initiator protein